MEQKYSIFLFSRFGSEAKYDVDCHHLILNDKKQSILTLGSQILSAYLAICGVKNETKQNIMNFQLPGPESLFYT